jgi:RNA polymerase sigma-70 factor (ECF subfamily)
MGATQPCILSVAVEPASRVSETDEELMKRSRDGDAAAFAVLVERHIEGVTARLTRLVRDPSDAQDLAQDAFMKIHANRHTYTGDGRFVTWLYRIATNAAIDHLRRQGRRRVVSLSAALPSSDPDGDDVELHETLTDPGSQAPDAALAVAERWAEIARALEGLSDDQKEMFGLRVVEGMDYRAIGERFGIGPEAARTRMCILRQEIRLRMR